MAAGGVSQTGFDGQPQPTPSITVLEAGAVDPFSLNPIGAREQLQQVQRHRKHASPRPFASSASAAGGVLDFLAAAAAAAATSDEEEDEEEEKGKGVKGTLVPDVPEHTDMLTVTCCPDGAWSGTPLWHTSCCCHPLI